jgi:uracil-DNA glycosylase
LPELARSFAGCDGGNVSAKLWVCGIEPYGEVVVLDDAQPHLSPYSTDWRYPPSWPEGFAANLNERLPAWEPGPGTYDTLLATLCWHIFRGAQTSDEYLMNRLYRANGDIFKLNLFPLPCQQDSQEQWTIIHQAISKCPRKEDYIQRSVENRRPFFRELIDRYKPQVLLCTGLFRANRFRQTFLTNPGAEPRDPIPVNDLQIERYRDEELAYTLLISPFLSNRNANLGGRHLEEFAGQIRPLLEGA